MQDNITIGCTTASTNTCCHAGLNGFRKSSLQGLKRSWSIVDQDRRIACKRGAMLILSHRPAGQHTIYRCMGHQRDISWTRPRPEHFHVLMLCTRHYNRTIRFTTASTDTSCHAGLNGFRKSRLHGRKRGRSMLTKIVKSLVKGMQCSYFHTDQLDQYPIYQCMGHGRDISWARPHPEHFHFLMLCTRHYNQTVR